MKRRSILVMIILLILTLGIYSIYWSCSFQNQLKAKTGKGFGAIGHLLAIIFTFGIYNIYWQYAGGSRLAMLGASNFGIMYLLLCFVGLSWLNPFIMQSQANGLPQNATA